MARRRRDAIPNRQYDEFQSTGYATVNISELLLTVVSIFNLQGTVS